MEDFTIQFDFYPAGKDYEIVMQDFGGMDSIRIERSVTMDYIGFSDTAIGTSEKFFVFIDNVNDDTAFKDFFNLLSYYELKSRNELHDFIRQLPKELQEEINKKEKA